jgi:hypothetical protein
MHVESGRRESDLVWRSPDLVLALGRDGDAVDDRRRRPERLADTNLCIALLRQKRPSLIALWRDSRQ